MSWCRLCCNPADQCVNIFSYLGNESGKARIPLEVKIYACLQIGTFPNDGLSPLICQTCISFVNSWFAFKAKADLAEIKQRDWIAQMPGFKFGTVEELVENSDEEIDVVDQTIGMKRNSSGMDGPSTSYCSHDLIAMHMDKKPRLSEKHGGSPENMLEVEIGNQMEKSEPFRSKHKRIRKKPLRSKTSPNNQQNFGPNALYSQDENQNPNLLYNPNCKDCLLIIKKNNELTKHMIIAHGFAGQIIECAYCEQTYLTESSMKNHVFKSHGVRNQEVKMIKCDYCEATVKSLPDMKKHIILDHQEMSHKLLNCTICPEQFINLTGLKAHLYKIHNVYKEDYHSVIPEIMNSLNVTQM